MCAAPRNVCRVPRLAALLLAACSGTSAGQPPTTYVFSHVAGAPSGGCLAEGPALTVPMAPSGLAAGPDGTIYFSDSSRATIGKITPAGGIVTVAGLAGARRDLIDGPPTHARFRAPGALARHADDLLVVDSGTLRVVDAGGRVTRYGPLAGVEITSIAAAPLDAQGGQLGGELGIYAVSGFSVLRIEPHGTVRTLAGRRDESGHVDGAGRDARFARINGLAIDGDGNVYVADGHYSSGSHGIRVAGNTIRKISPAGVVTTLAGTAGTFGWRDGQGAEARFTSPGGLALDRDGTLYVFDAGNKAIRRITLAGQVTTPAFGVTASTNVPSPLAVAPDGSIVYVHSHSQGSTVRRLLRDGTTAIVAGVLQETGFEDGPAWVARFGQATDVAVDPWGRLLVTDRWNRVIRRVDPDRLVRTVAGSTDASPADVLLRDGIGTEARFYDPTALTVDAAGNAFIVDGNAIRRMSPDGSVTTLAGAPGASGVADGPGTLARFDHPSDVAVDWRGAVFVADEGSGTIRAVERDGRVATLAGSPFERGHVDGAGSVARFTSPRSLVVDAAGTLFVGDGRTVRRVARSGDVATLAGRAEESGRVDGPGPAARFQEISGIAIGPDGSLFVTDDGAVRRVSPQGEVVTIAGRAESGCEDGPAASARFSRADIRLSVGWDGALFVADGPAVRRGVLVQLAPPTITGVAIQPPLESSSPLAITIFGTNFTPGGLSVTSGGEPAEHVQVLSGTVMLATWPASQAPARVDVTTPAGTAGATVGGHSTLLRLGVYPPGGSGRISVSATGYATGTTFDCEVAGATVRRTPPDPVHGEACEAHVAPNSRVRMRLEASPGSLSGWYEGLCGLAAHDECELLVVDPAPAVTGVWANFMPLPYARYFAEGVRNETFETRFTASTTSGPAIAALRYLDAFGASKVGSLWVQGCCGSAPFGIPASARRDIGADEPGMEQPWGSFATVIESTVPIAVQRTTRWDRRAHGGHSDTGAASAALNWYFAEGATHSGFNLFYLLLNPGNTAAEVEATYLLPAPQRPLVKAYSVAAGQRFTIWADQEDPALEATDVAVVFRVTNGQPIVAERSMYLDTPGLRFGAGHASTGVTAPATEWLFAEGATGDFFDTFYLIANPNDAEACLDAEYWLPDGRVVSRSHRVAPMSRLTIWVDREAPGLADTAVAARLRVTNAVPVVADRAMWWPGPTPSDWIEAHASAGATESGVAWLVADAEVDAARGLDTFVLIANPSADEAAVVVCLYSDEGATGCRDYPLGARRRLTISLQTELPRFPLSDRPPAASTRRFSVGVTSVRADGSVGNPPGVVVESAMYWNAEGPQGVQHWGGGTCTLATRIR